MKCECCGGRLARRVPALLLLGAFGGLRAGSAAAGGRPAATATCQGDRLQLVGGAVRTGALLASDAEGIRLAEPGVGEFHVPWDRIARLECSGPSPGQDREACLAFLDAHAGCAGWIGSGGICLAFGRLISLDPAAAGTALPILERALEASRETASYAALLRHSLPLIAEAAGAERALHLAALWRRGVRGLLHGSERWRHLAGEIAAWEAERLAACGLAEEGRQVSVWAEAVLGVPLDEPVAPVPRP